MIKIEPLYLENQCFTLEEAFDRLWIMDSIVKEEPIEYEVCTFYTHNSVTPYYQRDGPVLLRLPTILIRNTSGSVEIPYAERKKAEARENSGEKIIKFSKLEKSFIKRVINFFYKFVYMLLF
jgi:hypothetical protein